MPSANERILEIIYKSLKQEVLTAEEQAVMDRWLVMADDTEGILNIGAEDAALIKYLQQRLDTESLFKAMERFNAAAAAAQRNGEPPLLRLPGRAGRVLTGNRRWWAAAAILIIILSTAVAVSVTNGRRKDSQSMAKVNPRLSNDALPGSYRATLTLANGRIIMLDSTKGSIVQNGNFRVINQDGKLDYEGATDVAEYHTLNTPRGGQYKLLLPDGTKVWLNAASSITYPTLFSDKDRVVTITGEAYFEVAKDKTRPFHVKMKDMEVEVLGTGFNINAYEDEGSTRTTLLEGRIAVALSADRHPGINDAGQQRQHGSAAREILKPGQQAQVAGGIKVVENADLEQVMAWKNGEFQFDRTSLSAVMRQLSRWYDVEVVYEKGVPDIQFSGEMKRDLNLSQVLEGFGQMGVKFRIEGKKLIVTK